MGIDINSPFAQALIQEGKQRGYTPFDIAGTLGNANVENGLRTSGIPGDNGTAFGGMQWRMDRYDKLKALAQARGTSWTDPKVQAAHWYNEQDAEGNKGATTVDDANDNAIYSLKPGGFKPNAASYAGVSNFDNRLKSSQEAYAALTGQQPGATPQGDVPAAGATEAQGILSQQPQQAPPAPLSDSLDKLSAAFFRRDSPATAKAMTDDLTNKMYYQNQALQRAQAASDKFTTKYKDDGTQFVGKDGKTYTTVTGTDGSRKFNPVPEDQAKKPDADEPPTRQEVTAAAGQNTAIQNLAQLEPVRESINTLREALQKGSFKVGFDHEGKMIMDNITGNSTENDRYLKSMQSNIIAAATVVAQAQKGAMTNFKFNKDLQQVMPSFADKDPKAAYEALTRVSEGIAGAYQSSANAATTYGRQFKNLSTMVDPQTGEQVPVGDYFKNRIKTHHDREDIMRKNTPTFLAQPGRSGEPSKAPSFYDFMNPTK